jgi:hypothetical protein
MLKNGSDSFRAIFLLSFAVWGRNQFVFNLSGLGGFNY